MQFLQFRLDPENQCLWRRGDSAEDDRVLLTPKAFALLDYLLKHAGRLVTHDELLDALWARSYVQPEVLKHHVLEIRKALEDDPKTPRYIETLGQRVELVQAGRNPAKLVREFNCSSQSIRNRESSGASCQVLRFGARQCIGATSSRTGQGRAPRT